MKVLKGISITLIFVFLCVLSACTQDNQNNNNKGETTMVSLNDRQISICEDLGLPTSCEELTSDQKKKITRIEELLAYLDKKYNDSFSYVGYYEPFLESEKLEAYSSRFNEYEYVTLTVQEDGSFVDDYPFVIVGRLVRDDVVNFLKNETGFAFKAYVITGDTNISDVSSIDMSSVSGKTWISLTIFVNGNKSDEDARKIGDAIGEWYKQNGIYGSTNVVAADSGVFDSINFENYQSVKREQGASNLISCDVSQSGEVKIH